MGSKHTPRLILLALAAVPAKTSSEDWPAYPEEQDCTPCFPSTARQAVAHFVLLSADAGAAASQSWGEKLKRLSKNQRRPTPIYPISFST